MNKMKLNLASKGLKHFNILQYLLKKDQHNVGNIKN